MGVVLHEHLAEQPAEKLSVIEGEHLLQVIGPDHREVGGANLNRLLEHRFVDSPRAVRNFYRREKQRCELGLTFAPRSRGIDRDHVLHQTQRKRVDRIPVPRICLWADREPAFHFVYYPRLTADSTVQCRSLSLLSMAGLAQAEGQDSVTHARGVTRPGHLEGHESAIVADDGVGGLVMLRIKPGEKAGNPGLDLDLVDIAERLLDEQDALAVMREIGTLAAAGQASDVRRKILVRRGGRSSRRLCA